MNREKVINGLRSIKTYLASQAIESTDDFAREGFIESQRDIDDAIDLLKEQKAKTVIKIAKRFIDCDLTGYCPSCSRPLIKDWAENYCGYCGKPILWEGR